MQLKGMVCLLAGLIFYQLSFAQIKITEATVLPGRGDSLAASRQGHDTLPVLQKDTIKRRVFNPRTAALRSAILPGLGQIYNRKYWKVPIVYGALGATAAVFLFNLKEFNSVSYAYQVVINKDSANFSNVREDLRPFVQNGSAGALRNYRNEKRRDIDYSILVFAFAWALNVVDATVDAHLKGFDVSNDLSMKITPGFNPGTRTAALNLAFDIHRSRPKKLYMP